jgi:hypothetical protein
MANRQDTNLTLSDIPLVELAPSCLPDNVRYNSSLVMKLMEALCEQRQNNFVVTVVLCAEQPPSSSVNNFERIRNTR